MPKEAQLKNIPKPKLTFEFWYFVPREGVGHPHGYSFHFVQEYLIRSTPVVSAQRVPETTFRLPHVSDIKSLTPRHMRKAPDGALFSHVPREGVEPSRLATHDFESCAYTNSATEAIRLRTERVYQIMPKL